jgi:serine/threonine-protein kinase
VTISLARTTPLQLTEGLNVADRFRLVRLLGQGGMGSVWLADHLALDIPCAVKFIDREQNSPDVRRRFEREAKAAAQLRGQHVVQILDHGVWQEMPYIAMEYLEGEDLNARLERAVRLPHPQTVRIISQVAKGLARAHAAGIVHRDLKPENIFLAKDGDDEIVKVLDFGIAKRSQTSLSEAGTKTGSLLGTPFYMSPEQARGVKTIDHRSDLFSLAIIAYQCVTGKLPFYSEGLGDVLAQIMYEPIPTPSQQGLQVPAGFDAWWHRASARPVEARFQSAKDLADSLALALGVHNTVDIPMLEPRPVELSSPELPSIERIMAPTQLAIPGMRPAEHRTIDRPLTRTFDPTPEPSVLRRKNALLMGAGGFAVLLAIALVVFGIRRSASGASQPAAFAQGASAVEKTALVGGVAAPAGGANDVVPSDSPKAEPTSASSTDAPPPAAQPPKRKGKAPKGPSGPSPKRDYGI